ncbi:hypothetical protein [Vibrio algivorus]|uniref:DNA-binding protein H-NS-like N-terminal domain-containing protein n=1 Tax=Vibrio algivorus TaxID=1667024 RepID=A0A557PGX7_9VIBR|nr:hypothetical protein [Vibrio algivorus]TVO39892.1 hypothetical protein FOF44_00025 [Vibrio algivorus]
MSNDFITIISNQRKLKKALNGLPLNTLESIQQKLFNVIEEAKLKAQKEEEQAQEEHLKLEILRSEILESGVDFNKLSQMMASSKKRKQTKTTTSTPLNKTQNN